MDATLIMDELRDDDAPLGRAVATILGLKAELRDAKQHIAELEQQLKAAAPTTGTQERDLDYSVGGEEQRQQDAANKTRKKKESGDSVRNNELFTSVTFESATSPNGETHPASGTCNKSERQLRAPAQCRDTGRTSK
jgi:phenylalanyl-tRNA synthetase alpha subunit